jgi:hypothetical protein
MTEVNIDTDFGSLSGDPRRVPPPLNRKGTKIHAKFDLYARPEDVVATRTFGFVQAHERRCDATQETFDRTWAERERIRSFQGGKVVTRVSASPEPKDEHVLERVLHERESRRRIQSDESGRRVLPKEIGAYYRPPLPAYCV